MLAQRFRQPRLTQVGKIRAGLPPEKGKKHPRKLSTLRFTSPAEHLIVAIAEQYGGSPQIWEGSPRGRQWEVVTETASIPVFVPRQVIDAWFELWTANATLQRRCTGEQEMNRRCKCLCDPEGTMERDDPRRACSVVTRMTVMLADIPGVAGWGIESGGWNAVDEWSRYADLLGHMPEDALWPGRLILQPRSSNIVTEEGRQAREFMVPIVLFDAVTARALAGGAEAMQAMLSGAASAALPGGQQGAPALATGEPVKAVSATAAVTTDSIADMIDAAETRDDLIAVRDRMNAAGLGGDAELRDAWKARGVQLAEQRKKAAVLAEESATQTPGRVEPVPQTTSDRSAEDVYAEIVRTAGPSYTTSDINTVIMQYLDIDDVASATTAGLEEILGKLRDGQVEDRRTEE